MSEAAKALVEAQREMGKAFKGKANPAFRSKYADLGAVMDACFPALHAHGFGVIQPQGRDEHGDYVETVFLHETGERFASRVYLLIDKATMQGKGSAITYARRYGLIALAGIADTDDDGNAASEPKAAPEKGNAPRGRVPAEGGAQGLRDEAAVLYRLFAAADAAAKDRIAADNWDLIQRIRKELPSAAEHLETVMKEQAA